MENPNNSIYLNFDSFKYEKLIVKESFIRDEFLFVLYIDKVELCLTYICMYQSSLIAFLIKFGLSNTQIYSVISAVTSNVGKEIVVCRK